MAGIDQAQALSISSQRAVLERKASERRMASIRKAEAAARQHSIDARRADKERMTESAPRAEVVMTPEQRVRAQADALGIRDKARAKFLASRTTPTEGDTPWH